MTEMALSESLEDYLEAIFHIVQEKKAARPKDISRRLNVGNSAVTGALKTLASKELVNYAPYEVVTLTERGQAIAEDVVRRHEALHQFFVRVLAVEDRLAEEAACRMEHAVPAELLDRLVSFVDFVDRCPHGGPGLVEGFRRHLESGCEPDCDGVCQAPVLSVDTSLGSDGGGLTQPLPGSIPVAQEGGPRHLATVPPGARVTIVKVAAPNPLRKRLLDLGITAGAEVVVERVAPLGDPMEILIRGAHLTLRREEASTVLVDSVG
jgi:DtxR family Mn-dependent transcriptional regulator